MVWRAERFPASCVYFVEGPWITTSKEMYLGYVITTIDDVFYDIHSIFRQDPTLC